MPTKPTDDIEWGTDGAVEIAEPSSGQKHTGWIHGKKPPAHWFNWIFRAYWRWITYIVAALDLDSHNTVAITGDGSSTRAALTVMAGNSKIGIDSTGSTGSPGVKGTGGDSSYGGYFVGGSFSGIGVRGDGGSSGGVGGYFTGGSTNGNGAQGIAAGQGIGVGGSANNAAAFGLYATNPLGVALFVDSQSSPAKAPIRVQSSAAPSGASLIGDMYVTTAGVLKICTVAGTPGTWVSVGTQT